MCGISGIWHLNSKPLSEDKLKRFTDSMRHRGPDGGGYKLFAGDNLGFGHRRLSILDLTEAGKQPMSFADERYWITYNGEIYNFIELKQELTANGYSFKTNSDTEVLLSAYHFWGIDCLFKLNGMWAFAIWDSHEKSMFLARDRFGVKPLHYTFSPSEIFAFASETFAFKYLDDFKRIVNPEFLQRTIIDPRKLEPAGYTIFENVTQLAAGCYIILKQGQAVKQCRWWNTFKHVERVPTKFNEQVEHFGELFESACKIRLRSDVPLASAVSGGVDSSAVYCMVNHLMKKGEINQRIPDSWQKAFIATFPGTTQDERAFAEEVIAFTKGDAMYVEPDYKNLVDEVVNTTIKFDTITGTPIVAVTDVYKAMKESGITVSLDGHGADESMFGYRSSASEAYFDSLIKGDLKNEKEILDTVTQMFSPDDQIRAMEGLKERGRKVELFENAVRNQNRTVKYFKKLAKHIARRNKVSYLGKFRTDDWFDSVIINAPKIIKNNGLTFPQMGRADMQLADDFHIGYIPYNLRDFDRASMQNGIEIRMPFMDYRLVTFLFSLPAESKLGKGYTKLILRESMKGLMPESIRTRKLKIGFSAPMADWFNGPLFNFLMDSINSSEFINSPFWNGKVIGSFAEERVKNGKFSENDATRLWHVLNAHIILSNEKK